jgi:hypothetical protein
MRHQSINVTLPHVFPGESEKLSIIDALLVETDSAWGGKKPCCQAGREDSGMRFF